MKTKALLTALSLFIGLQITYAQTFIYGGSVEGLWSLNNSPYIIRGAVYVDDYETLQIEAGVYVIFQTTDRMVVHGSLIALGNSSDTINFSTDYPERGWGGIWFENILPGNDTSRLSYCKFEYARAKGEWPYNSGGAIGVFGIDRLSVDHCLFENNRAVEQINNTQTNSANGGAIAIWLSEIRLSKNVFRNNESINGGAVFITNHSKAIIDNSLFYGNTAMNSGGAVSVSDRALPNFINCTFADNYANNKGGAVAAVDKANPSFLNSLLWGNSAFDDGDQIYVEKYSGVNLNYTDIEGGLKEIAGYYIDNNENIYYEYDPKYLTNGVFPYSISASSSCVDLGTLDYLFMPPGYEHPDTDLLDNKRVSGKTIDVGYYENNTFKQSAERGADKFLLQSGNDWNIVTNAGTNSDLVAIQFTDDNHGWAAGKEATVVFTKDGGLSWEVYDFGPAVTLYDIYFLDNKTGFTAGTIDIGPFTRGIVYKTIDGGQNWKVSFFSESSMMINSIAFSDSQNGYLSGYLLDQSGNRPVLFKTTDRGAQWKRVLGNVILAKFDNITFSYTQDSGEIAGGWATGKINVGPREVSVVLNSKDGGNNWNAIYMERYKLDLADISFYDAQNGITIGDSGSVMITVDAGNNWMAYDFKQFSFNASLAVNNHYAIVVGDKGTILSTFDNGKHWVHPQFTVNKDLNAVCRTPGGFIWIAGDDGTLFSTNPRLNIQNINEQNPETVSEERTSLINLFANNANQKNAGVIVRYKNYPNPSSGKITISFELARRAYVKLDIYDINGRLILNLKDQNSEAGYQEIIFDSSDWLPGIYTYILRAGNNVRNGKMIIN